MNPLTDLRYASFTVLFYSALLALYTSRGLADQCSDILQQGIFDQFGYSSITNYQSDLIFVLSHTKRELEELNRTNDSSLTVGIKKLISLGFSSDSDDRQVRELAEELRVNQVSSIQFSNVVNVTTKVVAPAIVNAWRDCMMQSAGLKADIIGNPKENEQFIVRVSYIPRNRTDRAVRIRNVSTVGAVPVSPTHLQTGAVINTFSDISQIFRRTGRQAVTVSVDFDGANGAVARIPEIVSAPAASQPITQTYVIPSSNRDYVPPKVGSGDADFDTGPDKPMSIRADSQIEIRGEKDLVLRLSMNAKEPRSDWTEVNGRTELDDDRYKLYSAPSGWRIKRVVNPVIMQDYIEFLDGSQGEKTFDPSKIDEYHRTAADAIGRQSGLVQNIVRGVYLFLSSVNASKNSVVEQWKFYTDGDGDEAGSRTSVSVKLFPITVELEQVNSASGMAP